MFEELTFQEFGIRRAEEHVIDPSVIIKIEEAVINSQGKRPVTGVLFGKQKANNLEISMMMFTYIGALTEDMKLKENSELERLIKYYENVYSLVCVGFFSHKDTFDKEAKLLNQLSFKYKTTNDYIFLIVSFDPEAVKFSYSAYYSLSNRFFKEQFVLFQKSPIKIDFVGESFPHLLQNVYTGQVNRTSQNNEERIMDSLQKLENSDLENNAQLLQRLNSLLNNKIGVDEENFKMIKQEQARSNQLYSRLLDAVERELVTTCDTNLQFN